VVVLGEASKEAMDDKIRGAFTPQERGKLRVRFAAFETLLHRTYCHTILSQYTVIVY